MSQELHYMGSYSHAIQQSHVQGAIGKQDIITGCSNVINRAAHGKQQNVNIMAWVLWRGNSHLVLKHATISDKPG